MPTIRLAILLCGPFLLLGSGVLVRGGTEVPDISKHRYAEHPPLAHTGGFGEPTCHACHFGGEVNGGEGTIAVTGLPSSIRPGHSYRIAVRLSAEMKRAGFMLGVRTVDGTQAGRLSPVDTARAAVHSIDSTGVQYAHHTLSGTELRDPNRAVWRLRWTAPAAAGDSVLVHVAANAANDDASEFGDNIYTVVERARVAVSE